MSTMTSSQSLFLQLDDLIASQFPNSTPASALQSLGTPSASIAVLTTSDIITHTISNPSSPTDLSTLFQACSISKPICGLAILRTIDQGKLHHSDPITKHLPPEYIDLISTPATRPLLDHLTIRHLISHTGGTQVSGFPGYDCDGPVPSVKTILEGGPGSNTPQIRLTRLQGLKWRYSGGGTTLLHVILECIHKKPLPEIMKELVLDPLDMSRSFYSLPEGETNFAQCWSTGVTESTPARWHIQPELGAAGLWTTPTDLLKAQRAIRDAALGRNDFLSTELAVLGLTAVEGANRWTNSGWMSAKNWFGHGGGNNPGYKCQALACFDFDGKGELGKAEDEGVVIMTNSALGTEVCLKIIQAVAYLRGWPGREVVGLHERGNAAVALRDPRGEIDGRWKEWMGTWRVVSDRDDCVREGQEIEIAQGEKGWPVVQLDDLPSMRLVKAVTPTTRYGRDKKEGIDLVVEGLDMMLSFGFDDESQRTLQIWPGFWEDPMECKQT